MYSLQDCMSLPAEDEWHQSFSLSFNPRLSLSDMCWWSGRRGLPSIHSPNAGLCCLAHKFTFRWPAVCERGVCVAFSVCVCMWWSVLPSDFFLNMACVCVFTTLKKPLTLVMQPAMHTLWFNEWYMREQMLVACWTELLQSDLGPYWQKSSWYG